MRLSASPSRGWQVVFIAYLAALLTIFALAYGRLIPVELAAVPFYDTIGHVVLFGAAAYLGHRAAGRRALRLGSLALPLLPLLVGAFALAEECLQALSPNRTFDLVDLLCDGLGIGLALLVDQMAQRPARLVLLLAPALLILGGPFVLGLLFGLAQSLGLFSVVDVGGPTLAFYAGILTDRGVARALGLTLYVALASTALATALSLGLALLLRRAWRGASGLRLLVQLPLPVPHLVAALGVTLLLAQSGLVARLLHAAGLLEQPADFPALVYDRGAVGIIATYVWKEVPFITLVTLAALRASGEEIERAARNLGATGWQTLRHVTLPLIAPAVLGAATIVFAFTFGAFEVPLLLGQSFPRTMPVEAYLRYQDTDLSVRPAALALNSLIAALTFLAVPPYIWLLRRAGMLGDATRELKIKN